MDKYYDKATEFIWEIVKTVLIAMFKFVVRVLRNSLKIRKLLKTRKHIALYCLTTFIIILCIWMLKLHPGVYIISLFGYFVPWTLYQDIKQMKKRRGIKKLNKKYKRLRDLFDNKIDVVKISSGFITIYTNELTEKDIRSKHSKIELFFNRKIADIRRQEKSLRYIDIIFQTKTKFRDKYYLEQYIEYIDTKKLKKMILPVVLGIDEQENIHLADMTKLNHIFISGESDTGKSVLLNQIIQSLMVFNNNIQYILVDLKEGVEFYDYSKFPNCLIISNMKELFGIIEHLGSEMVERLNKIKVTAGCKNIIQYNKNNSEKMNYIIMVVDEFATIKLENGEMKNLESKILSILQKGRAAGIYLIGATQRPSSNQINTDVRAGFLWNISLRVKTPETQRMTKIYGTENLKIGEFKTDIVKDTVMKSFYIDEDTHNGVYENLEHRIIKQKEFIQIKDKQIKKLSLYKRLCNYVDMKLYKRRTIDCMSSIDYRQYIKLPEPSVIAQVEQIKQLYGIGQNNPQNDTSIQPDNYSKFLEYIFRQNKENGLLPDSKEIEGALKISRHTRLKLQDRAIEDGYIEKTSKTRFKIIPGKVGQK
jgi:hypothetical protein